MTADICKKIFIAIALFIFSAVALGFFAAIGVWAAVSFLKLFGTHTLQPHYVGRKSSGPGWG